MQIFSSRCNFSVRVLFGNSRTINCIGATYRSHSQSPTSNSRPITVVRNRGEIRLIMSAPAKQFAKKASKDSSAASTQASSTSTSLACIQSDKKGQLLLHVEAKPGVKSGEEGLFLNPSGSSPSLLVRIDAQPVEGEANRAIQALLSSELSLRKTAIKLISGETNKFKCFAIEADADKGGVVKSLTPQSLSERLRSKLSSSNNNNK